MPYCSAGRPVLGERKISLSSLREISTGKVALSVKPAASEINLGRASAVCMSQEMGGSAVRRPILDRASVSCEKEMILTANIERKGKDVMREMSRAQRPKSFTFRRIT